MSIGTEHWASEGVFATYDPFKSASRVTIFRIQCRSCGYEPDDAMVTPRTCPKCHGDSWERFAQPGSILSNADRY
jgi:uncharacterized OB-fold protein